MFNIYKSLKKNDEENYNSFTTNFTNLHSNLPFQIENNCQDYTDYEQKEFNEFLLKDANNNIINPFNFANNFIASQSEEEKERFEMEGINKKENKNNIKFKVNKKIFKIEKKIKRGRSKKSSNKMGKHNKYKWDNLIRRFKVFLTNNIYNYINDSFEVNKNKDRQKKIKTIKYVSSKLIKSIKKVDNLNWINSKLKDFYSNEVSSRFFTYNNQYNKKLIDKIYKKGKEKKVIEILEKTIYDFWEIYINGDKDNKYNGFKTLKDDIIILREKKGETEKYIEKYIYYSKNFMEIFEAIHSRKVKKTKND